MCCVSLACNVHRDTPRVVEYCSGKLQRGTCAKNTILVNKNDPNLTCSQCAIRDERYTARLPSVDMRFDSEVDFIPRDDGDVAKSHPQEYIIQLLPDEVCQDSSRSQACSQLPSTGTGHRLDADLGLDEFDLVELSYEDGLQLIDETFSAEYINCSMENMDADENKMYLVSADPNLDPELMYSTTDDDMQNSQVDITTDTFYLFQQQCNPSYDLGTAKEITTEEDMIRARQFLLHAQQELEMLQRIQQGMEPHHFMQLGYSTSSQILVDSRS